MALLNLYSSFLSFLPSPHPLWSSLIVLTVSFTHPIVVQFLAATTYWLSLLWFLTLHTFGPTCFLVIKGPMHCGENGCIHDFCMLMLVSSSHTEDQQCLKHCYTSLGAYLLRFRTNFLYETLFHLFSINCNLQRSQLIGVEPLMPRS